MKTELNAYSLKEESKTCLGIGIVLCVIAAGMLTTHSFDSGFDRNGSGSITLFVLGSILLIGSGIFYLLYLSKKKEEEQISK